MAPATMDVPDPLVNPDEPLLGQVARMGDAYDGWVHRPIPPPVGGASRALRIFRSDLLESLSHPRWWQVPLVWIPAVSGLVVVGWRGLGTTGAAAWTLGGLLAWPLVEYAIHRWIFHVRPRTALGRRIHFLAHGIHHLDPWDRTRLVLPPLGAALLATPVFGVAWLLLPGLPAAASAMAGILLGYVAYDLTHYYAHHGRPRGRVGRFFRSWHLSHHHRHPDRMFGVSQPFWDLILGTGRPRS